MTKISEMNVSVHAPLPFSGSAAILAAILAGRMAAFLGGSERLRDRYNYGLDNRPVNIFVDEAAEVINDPCIQLLNKGRGVKFRLSIATQTFADFAARTGSEAKAGRYSATSII